MATRPRSLSVRSDRLLVVDDQSNLFEYQHKGGSFDLISKSRIRSGAVALCERSDRAIVVAYRQGLDHSVREYVRHRDGWREARIVVPSLYDQWPALYMYSVPLVRGPDHQIWFGGDIHGSILSLDPATDRVAERIRGVHRPLSLGFDNEETLYVSGHGMPGKGPSIQRFTMDGKRLGPFGASPVYAAKGIPVWALLPDRDGGVYLRIVEEGWRKGQAAFTLKRMGADGRMETVLDLGFIYAVRSRFHPAASTGNLVFDPDGNLVLAVSIYAAVIKLSPAGDVLWEASEGPRTADRIPFVTPRDLCVDSRNNIWVVDSDRNEIICLSSEGKHLLTYSEFTGMDEQNNDGFNGPSGIACVRVGNREYLVVGDYGNQRFVKFRLTYADRAAEE